MLVSVIIDCAGITKLSEVPSGETVIGSSPVPSAEARRTQTSSWPLSVPRVR